MRLTFLLLLPLTLQAQEITKKANVIIVRAVTLQQVANALLDKGYIIETIDCTQ